jgi:hypothetical protein
MSNYVVIDGDRYDFKNVSKITEDSCSVCALKNFCNIEDTPCSVFNPSETVPNQSQYAFVKHVKFQNNGKEIIKNKVMTKYIDKDAVVAKIKELIRANELYLSKPETDEIKFQKTGAYSVLNDLLHSLDTFEVKEVNLEKEIEEQITQYYNDCEQKLKEMDDNDNDFSFMTLDNFAKHFFELGLKAQKGE